MAGRKGTRGTGRIQTTKQLQAQLTEQRRDGMETVGAWRESLLRPGQGSRNSDLGRDDEADGDTLAEDEGSGEPDGLELIPAEESEDDAANPQLSLTDILGSRPPVVLLRLDCEGDDVAVRILATAHSDTVRKALELLQQFVQRCFKNGRSSFTDEEWGQLLGHTPAPLTRRLTLLLLLAVKGNEKVSLGEDTRAVFTPHDVGLECFASKFAALPDGTPFSIRLLLLDERGRKTEKNDDFFDQLPDVIKLLALRRALAREEQTGVAVSDNEFRDAIQSALEALLGTPIPKPTEDQVRRRLRDNFKRKGLANLFPNQRERQQSYNRRTAGSPGTGEETV